MKIFKNLKASNAETALKLCHIYVIVSALLIGACGVLLRICDSAAIKITAGAVAVILLGVFAFSVKKSLRWYIICSSYAERLKVANLRKSYFIAYGPPEERLLKMGFKKGDAKEVFVKQFKDNTVKVSINRVAKYSREDLYKEALRLAEDKGNSGITEFYLLIVDDFVTPEFEDVLPFESVLNNSIVLPCIIEKCTEKTIFDAGALAGSSKKHLKQVFFEGILGKKEEHFSKFLLSDISREELANLSRINLYDELTKSIFESESEENISFLMADNEVREEQNQLFIKIDGKVFIVFFEKNGRRVDVYIDDYAFEETSPKSETIEKMKTIIQEYYQAEGVNLVLHTDVCI